MKMTTTLLATCLLVVSLAHADERPNIHSDKNACMTGGVAQFGRYIGDWKIEDETLARDGSGWQPGEGARWIFFCVGPGVAVQDYWMPTGGGFGTNLRTFNPETGSWEIAWATAGQNGFMHISALETEGGDIVMNVDRPVLDPPRRIIFFAPEEEGWRWVQQRSFDGGDTWTDVYRMKATRWQD